MSSIFPIRDTVTRDETREPRLIDLDEDTADEVFEALASQTTRQIFLALHEDPQTASDLAEETETSVQNVQYHLEKLTDIDLVEVADTWYSERGSEMKVYAPTDESLVLYAGRDKQTTFRSLLKRFTGVFSLLVPGSLLASWFASRSGSDGNTGSDPTQISGGDEYNVATGSEPEITSLDTADGGQYAPEDTEVAIAENGTADNGTASGDFTSLSPEDVEYSFESSADIFLSGNATDQPILITDGGNATAVPNGSTVQATSDTAAAAGLDPALAAGVAFLLGGLLVAVALLAYYGVPE